MGSYYDNDNLIYLNSSLQINSQFCFLNYCRLLFQFVCYGQINIIVIVIIIDGIIPGQKDAN